MSQSFLHTHTVPSGACVPALRAPRGGRQGLQLRGQERERGGGPARAALRDLRALRGLRRRQALGGHGGRRSSFALRIEFAVFVDGKRYGVA